jgi:hypothetical protein
MMKIAQLKTEGIVLMRQRLRQGPALDRVLDLRSRRYLIPYLGQVRSVSEAAAELGVGLSRMSYQTRQLKSVGLIEEVEVRARAGRPVSHYRSTSDQYLVALHDLDQRSIEDYLLESEEPLRRAMAKELVLSMGRSTDRSGELALLLSRREDGEGDFLLVNLSDTSAAELGDATYSWSILHLDRGQATQLVRELDELTQRWGALSRTGQRYVLRVALARVDDGCASQGKEPG